VDYSVVTTGLGNQPGINGVIMPRVNQHATRSSIDFSSVGEFAGTRGGVMLKTSIPALGYFGYCADTEGNVFGIMRTDPTAC